MCRIDELNGGKQKTNKQSKGGSGRRTYEWVGWQYGRGQRVAFDNTALTWGTDYVLRALAPRRTVGWKGVCGVLT